MEVVKLFENYLKASKKVSGKTLRNYRADFLHFLNWSIAHLSSTGVTVLNAQQLLPYFTSTLVANYKGTQLEKGVPEATTNRRLSTLRSFSKFALEAGFLQHNPMEIINNIKPKVVWEKQTEMLVLEFTRHLEAQGMSNITKKNYLSDVRQFLAWVPGQEI